MPASLPATFDGEMAAGLEAIDGRDEGGFRKAEVVGDMLTTRVAFAGAMVDVLGDLEGDDKPCQVAVALELVEPGEDVAGMFGAVGHAARLNVECRWQGWPSRAMAVACARLA